MRFLFISLKFTFFVLLQFGTDKKRYANTVARTTRSTYTTHKHVRADTRLINLIGEKCDISAPHEEQ